MESGVEMPEAVALKVTLHSKAINEFLQDCGAIEVVRTYMLMAVESEDKVRSGLRVRLEDRKRDRADKRAKESMVRVSRKDVWRLTRIDALSFAISS